MTLPAVEWSDDPIAEARLSVHEAVCAERYANILTILGETSRRVSRLEVMVLYAAGALMMGMGGLIVTLALKLGHL
jgi:hypothetical protein